MPSSITEEAIKIINAAPAHGPLQPKAYAEALPPRAAALADMLNTDEIGDAAEKYHQADKRAMRAQKRFTWLAWIAAYSGFFAAAMGGVLLYMGSNSSTKMMPSALGILQFVFLAISLLGSLILYLWKPFRAWRVQRGEAEVARLEFFRKLVAFPTKQADSLFVPLKLECFRRHLLCDQQAYFERRGKEHRKTVRVWTAVRSLALLLIVAASLPLLARLEPFSWLPEVVRKIMSWLPLTGAGVPETYALAGLIGASLQGLLAALSSISLAERNAERFEAMVEHLGTYAGKTLDEMRSAAARLDGNIVENYANLISTDLLMEASDWGAWHEARSEMAIKLLSQAHKVTP